MINDISEVMEEISYNFDLQLEKSHSTYTSLHNLQEKQLDILFWKSLELQLDLLLVKPIDTWMCQIEIQKAYHFTDDSSTDGT